MSEEKLRENLKELLDQWEESLYAEKMVGDRFIAIGYEYCIDELEKILNDDLSPIERMEGR